MGIATPFEKIVGSCVQAIHNDLYCDWKGSKVESEIERVLLTALHAKFRYWGIFCPYNQFVVVGPKEILRTNSERTETIFCQQQVKIQKYRVDFLFHGYVEHDYDYHGQFIYQPHKWKKLVVECDGHDFHERTKEQAASDRSRDRALILSGYGVMRFTGSELWADPFRCAEDVIDWFTR